LGRSADGDAFRGGEERPDRKSPTHVRPNVRRRLPAHGDRQRSPPSHSGTVRYRAVSYSAMRTTWLTGRRSVGTLTFPAVVVVSFSCTVAGCETQSVVHQANSAKSSQATAFSPDPLVPVAYCKAVDELGATFSHLNGTLAEPAAAEAQLQIVAGDFHDAAGSAASNNEPAAADLYRTLSSDIQTIIFDASISSPISSDGAEKTFYSDLSTAPKCPPATSPTAPIAAPAGGTALPACACIRASPRENPADRRATD